MDHLDPAIADRSFEQLPNGRPVLFQSVLRTLPMSDTDEP